MKKILLVFGTRPEAIKLCPVAIEGRRHVDKFEIIICVTGQHRSMLDQVLRVFDVVPDYDLNVMRKNQRLRDVSSAVLMETGRVIDQEKPDIVLVQGDTTTTFAASLAAFYNLVKVGHIEAGLRTGRKYSPFPEEMNRKLTGQIADVHFAATKGNKDTLISEGVAPKNIVVTGNTVIDALLWVKKKVNSASNNLKGLDEIDFAKKIILVTGHRRENFGEHLVNICLALKEIAEIHHDVQIVYPVHLNPNVKKPAHDILEGVKNIQLIEPLEYNAFIYLMAKCHFIISDSGGIQEEAPSLGKPILVTRKNTERPEAIASGAAKLVGTIPKNIVNEANSLLNDQSHYANMSKIQNPFGDGNASKRIISWLADFL